MARLEELLAQRAEIVAREGVDPADCHELNGRIGAHRPGGEPEQHHAYEPRVPRAEQHHSWQEYMRGYEMETIMKPTK